MAKMIEKVASVGAFVFGVISLIVCATAAGTKNTLFIPLVVCLVLGCILAAAALFVFFRQQRRQGEILDGEESFLGTYGHFILTIGTTVFFLVGFILFIVIKANGGLSLGDSYKTEHIDLDQQLADLGIGNCDNFDATSSYCSKNKQECTEFIQTCMEKSEVVHASAYVSFVFLILALVLAGLSAFFAFTESRQDDDENYGTYQPNTAPRNGNTFKSDYVPGDNRMQSPLV